MCARKRLKSEACRGRSQDEEEKHTWRQARIKESLAKEQHARQETSCKGREHGRMEENKAEVCARMPDKEVRCADEDEDESMTE
jgi:hypothetical protein